MKLWEENKKINEKVDQFTVGNDRKHDLKLAKYDCEASIAHAKMLYEIGILTEHETNKICEVLLEIKIQAQNGNFTIENKFEDMHSKIEYILINKLGDIGKKIHTARSRNDQVLVAMHLYLKNEISLIKLETKNLFDLLINLSEKHKADLLPGYTHFQTAMPTSFGMWFSAYAESLIDDVQFLNTAYCLSDQNPLGSAAGFGSSFPINRELTTKLLGFNTLKFNSTAAQMSRGKVEKSTAIAISILASTLAKLSMDICLYMGQDYEFISFPDNLTTGSSIMPHKKNPDIFELIRGKCNMLQGVPYQLSILMINLPSGYHRDLQLTKGPIINAIEELKSCLEILILSLPQIKISKKITDQKKYDTLFSVDTLNAEVNKGKPFRDVYIEYKKSIKTGKFKPDRSVKHSHTGSIGNLSLKKIKHKFKKMF